jgi:RimJ/RimL family protein N-acetyltransferase
VELRLEHCLVREWRLEDAKSLATYANNRLVWRGLRDQFPHPYTIEDAHAFLRSVTNKQPVTNFCIEIEAAAAGGIGIRIGEDVHRQTANLGYWLGEEFWGRGIMTEVVSAVVTCCFEKFPLNRICAEVYSNNPASARVLEKAGFVLEGRLRKNVVKEREILDSLLYARTT